MYTAIEVPIHNELDVVEVQAVETADGCHTRLENAVIVDVSGFHMPLSWPRLLVNTVKP